VIEHRYAKQSNAATSSPHPFSYQLAHGELKVEDDLSGVDIHNRNNNGVGGGNDLMKIYG
jgi:hypothetical protein